MWNAIRKSGVFFYSFWRELIFIDKEKQHLGYVFNLMLFISFFLKF